MTKAVDPKARIAHNLYEVSQIVDKTQVASWEGKEVEEEEKEEEEDLLQGPAARRARNSCPSERVSGRHLFAIIPKCSLSGTSTRHEMEHQLFNV